MENFLKQNWLKIIIVIVLLVAGYYGLSTIIKNNGLRVQLANQEKCGQEGLKFYQSYEQKHSVYGGIKFNDPIYHFNQKLNTCLVSISYRDSTHYSLGKPVYDIFHAEADDVYSNKVLITTDNFDGDKTYQQQENTLMNE